MNAVLQASRYGNESWEMYCFNHGFPTRNPGTWMPSTNSLGCRNEACKQLSEIWTQMWKRGKGENWKQRQAMECAVCSKERQMRICILQDSQASQARFLSEEFAAAPYVHPFRHPSYHATQLRALVFAKNAKKRLHWTVAHDTLADKSQESKNVEKAESRKEQWLEYHDRVTGGIPGLFPFVLDLPIRFTEAIDKKSRELGVFKHSRGWLRGWKLPPDEQARLEQIDDPEVVLQGRPTHLFIEVQTATKSMPTVDAKKSTLWPCSAEFGTWTNRAK